MAPPFFRAIAPIKGKGTMALLSKRALPRATFEWTGIYEDLAKFKFKSGWVYGQTRSTKRCLASNG
jgi:hypothetical protein